MEDYKNKTAGKDIGLGVAKGKPGTSPSESAASPSGGVLGPDRDDGRVASNTDTRK